MHFSDVPLVNNGKAALRKGSSAVFKLAINVVLECGNRSVTHPVYETGVDVTDLLEQTLTALKSDCALEHPPVAQSAGISILVNAVAPALDCLVVYHDVLAPELQHPSCTGLGESLQEQRMRTEEWCWCAYHTTSPWQGHLRINQINIDVVLSNVALASAGRWFANSSAFHWQLTRKVPGQALDVADHLCTLNDVCRNVASNKVCLGDI